MTSSAGRPATLILIVGMPGAGKSTLARALAAERPAARLSPDEWIAGLEVDLFDAGFRDRLERTMWAHAQELLGIGTDVVLEWGHWLIAEREAKRRWARDAGVRVELHVLDVPLDERWRRIRLRNASGLPFDVPLTRELLVEYELRFQLPDADERARYDAPA